MLRFACGSALRVVVCIIVASCYTLICVFVMWSDTLRVMARWSCVLLCVVVCCYGLLCVATMRFVSLYDDVGVVWYSACVWLCNAVLCCVLCCVVYVDVCHVDAVCYVMMYNVLSCWDKMCFVLALVLFVCVLFFCIYMMCVVVVVVCRMCCFV